MYDREVFERFADASGLLPVPVMVGLLPLVSSRQAEYLHNEVPGIVIPDSIRMRIGEAGEDASRLGAEMALEFLAQVRERVQGAYVIPSLGRYELASQVVTQARELVGQS
jgi:homocysteine S-methyltransferase